MLMRLKHIACSFYCQWTWRWLRSSLFGAAIVLLGLSTLVAEDQVPAAIFEPLVESAPPHNAGLFIGVNEFPVDDVSPLRYAVHDAIEQAYLFVVRLKLIDPKNCRLALAGSPSAEIVRQHLAELQRLGVHVVGATQAVILQALITSAEIPQSTTDMLIMGVSTHGFVDGVNAYIMPADGLRRALSRTAIPLNYIEEQLHESRAGHRLFLVDACQEKVSIDAKAASETMPQGVAMNAVFANALKSQTGQAKFSSCDVGQFSYEFATLRGCGHGVFTAFLLDAMEGGAAADAQNLIRLRAVADYTARQVEQWAKEHNLPPQIPSWSGPKTAEQLPLAMRAGDLQTIIVTLKRHALSTNFNESLRADLINRLKIYDSNNPADRELLTSTRDFLNGHLQERFFVLYLRALPTREVDTFKNSIGMTLKHVPAGAFSMGSDETENEQPRRDVQLTKSFYLQSTEVTQGQWHAVMGTSPWLGQDSVKVGPDFAATYISWEDATEFCRKLAQREGKLYRLPTEAEWEYACRGGTTTRYSFGDNAELVGDFAWIGENTWENDETYAHQVGRKRPNSLGLFDMHGNVWEWCQDWYDDSYHSHTSMDPKGPLAGSMKVIRSGSWDRYAVSARSASRDQESPESRYHEIGFRVVLESP